MSWWAVVVLPAAYSQPLEWGSLHEGGTLPYNGCWLQNLITFVP